MINVRSFFYVALPGEYREIDFGDDSEIDFGYGVMLRLVRALSNNTIIKKLHVKVFASCKLSWGFAYLLLESMLSLLSGSTPQAFFPSLQTLRIAVYEDGDHLYDSKYGPDDIESLLYSIDAVRPPSLKAIIFDETDD